ncbi:hypothetical protein R1flu_012608 [Riccia fluitans]|uniref:Uncharacterized protein n=1 Tax=Riccia fluitans TaxID=41844 RepID=A0ABD1ZB38_9MARC
MPSAVRVKLICRLDLHQRLLPLFVHPEAPPSGEYKREADSLFKNAILLRYSSCRELSTDAIPSTDFVKSPGQAKQTCTRCVEDNSETKEGGFTYRTQLMFDF